MDDLEGRLRFTAKALDRVGLGGDGKLVIEAADRLRTYREALEWIAEHTTADSVHYGVARQALKG